jgi:hypothetical protein
MYTFFVLMSIFFDQFLGKMSPNVPAVWNVSFFKKPERLSLRSLMRTRYTFLTALSTTFLQNSQIFLKKILSVKTANASSYNPPPAYAPPHDPVPPRRSRGLADQIE